MLFISSLTLMLSQTPTPPENGSAIEWIIYLAGTVGTLWAGDKAWWHVHRIRSKRHGPETLPSVDDTGTAINRLAKQQERQSEVLSTMSLNQHHHIEATQALDRRLNELEHKTDNILQQTVSNSKDLEHLKDLQRMKGH